MSRRWSQSELLFLEENSQTMTSSEIGNAINRTAMAVRKKASGCSISLLREWTDEEDAFLKNNAQIETREKLAEKLDRSVNSISYRASCLGISLTGQNGICKNRKHKVNHNYFDRIDTPSKAYWLGVLWADGCVREQKVRGGKTHIIKLESRVADETWLKSFAEDIDSSYPLSYSNRGNGSVCLRMSSKKIFDALASYGVVPRKTYKNRIPTGVPSELLSHFVRGLFDGDGSVSGVSQRPLVRLVNTKDLCYWLLRITQEELQVGGGVYPKTDVAYTWALGGALQGKVFVDWIYKDAFRYLERKYNKCKVLGLV